MLILALDTSTPAGSVALWHERRLLEVRSGDARRTHAERLPGDLIAPLAAHGRTLADVDLFAVVSGPGGFTGLRVGIATIQGLALVGHRAVFAASALLLLAVAATRTDPSSPADHGPLTTDHSSGWTLVGAWMHAARGEVFTALYQPLDEMHTAPPDVTPTGATLTTRVGLVTIEEAAVGAPDTVAARWQAREPSPRLCLMGDATGDLADPLRRRFGNTVDLCSPPPLAGVLATLAAALPDLAVSPHAIVPTYVRRSDAELARDRMASVPGGRS